MFVLPPALAALRAYRQFIVFKLVPSASRPGKTDKLPIDWQSGRLANAHDPAIWLSVEEAAAVAAAFDLTKDAGVIGYGVGFVLTPTDPFWFIDVDECLEADGTWSATAQALMQRFAGAAWEVSASARGLHGIGMGNAGPPPPARKVKYHHYFDLYTEGRFAALTGTNAVGDAATTHDAALNQLVLDYLTPDAATPTDWTTEPRADWRGPTDDADLIARALRSQSANQAFGARASFADLWNADAEKLAKFFPDPGATRLYNESTADSSLAQALAFWTGCDCERIRRLMLQSALKRDKWEREDYLPRTIKGVVSRQYDVLQDKPPEPAAGVAAASAASSAVAVTGETYLSHTEQMAVFAGCVYIVSKHKVLVPGGFVWKPDQFKVMYGGYTMPLDAMNEKLTRNAWEAFTESQMYRSPRADALTFRPECAPGEVIREGGLTLANVWWPIETPCASGDPSRFLTHLAKLLPDAGDREKLLSFMAALVQYPGRKFQWAPLVQGVEGNGKTFFIRAITYAVGDRYTHLPNTEDLIAGGAKFTGWLEQKLFIGLEEIYTGDRRNMMEVLKPLITNDRIEIQAKGFDQITGDNRANIMACSNHKDAVPKTANDRRWGIFFCAQQDKHDLTRDGMTGDYMPDLYNWANARGKFEGQTPGYAIINQFLRDYKIREEFNPASGAHRAPETTSTEEAIRLSAGTIEQEVQECIDRDEPGFSGGWVSSMMLDKLLVRINAERRLPPRRRREMLQALGFDWHPALVDGRSPVSVQPDGGKTRIFVKLGHPNASITEPATVSKLYSKAQTEAVANKANFGT